MDAENRGPQLAAVTIALLAACWVSVCMRSYTMVILLKRFYAEDWLAVVTLLVYTAYSTFSLLGVHYGLGAHLADVPVDDRPKALLWKWAGQVAYVAVSVMVKFIAGFLLLRLCAEKRWQRITLWTLLGFVGVYNLFYVFIVIFQCRPVRFYWFRYESEPPVTGICNGHLLAMIPTYVAFVISMVSDWILALIPVSIVWNAKMDFRTKVSVSCVLALGSIASLATVVRIPYAKQLISSPEYLYNFTDLAIWSTVEIGLGLTATSLATLRPLFRKLKILARTKSGSRLTGTARRTRTGTARSQIRCNSAEDVESGRKRGISVDSQEFKLTWDSGSVTTSITAQPMVDDDHIVAHPLPPYRHVFRTKSILSQRTEDEFFGGASGGAVEMSRYRDRGYSTRMNRQNPF